MGTLVNGIKEIFSTSKTTATHLPVCASDGTPQGRIPVADLARVLGGQYIAKTDSVYDLNTLTTQGKYILGNNNTNAPSSDYGFLIVEVRDSVVYQWFYRTGGVDCYYRVKNGNIAWTSWSSYALDIPAFYKNYSTLEALAGVVLQRWGSLGIKGISGETNIDTLDGGLYDGIGWSLGSNNVAGYLLCLKYTDNYKFQVALTYGSNSNEIYHRSYNVSYGWSPWKKVTSA